MAISRNQLLLGGGIVALLAVLYVRARKRNAQKKIDDAVLPAQDFFQTIIDNTTKDKVEPVTGGVKPPKPTKPIVVDEPLPTNGGATLTPINGGVKPPKQTPIITQPISCADKWKIQSANMTFSSFEDMLKKKNAFMAQCSGMPLAVPYAPPRTTVEPLRPKGVGFMDNVGTLDTFSVY